MDPPLVFFNSLNNLSMRFPNVIDGNLNGNLINVALVLEVTRLHIYAKCKNTVSESLGRKPLWPAPNCAGTCACTDILYIFLA